MAKEKDDDELDEDDEKKKPKKKEDLDDKSSKTKLFMAKLITMLKDLMPANDFNKAMKSARGSSGGEMKKRRRISSEGSLSPKAFDDDFAPAYRPKKAKETVSYTEASTVGEQCQQCRFYLGGACRLVEGSIFPDDICSLFELKLQLFNDNVADICAGSRQDSSLQLFNALASEYSEPPEWIPFLPKPGEYNSPKYGDIFITEERNKHFIENFEAGVYQEALPISSEHIDADQDGAYGWIEGMRMNEDGSVDAQVKWSDRGVDAIENDRFRYFSPEFHDVYKDNKEVVHKDVAVGGALTTRPFFKEDDLRPLVASEGVLQFNEGDNLVTFTSAATRRKEDDMSKKKGDAGASKEPGKFQQFKEGLTVLLKKFGDDAEEGVGETGDATPTAAELEAQATAEAAAKATADAAELETKAANEKKSAAERFNTLEAENRALKASEAKHAAEVKASDERIAALEMSEHTSRFEKIVMGEGQAENRWVGKSDEHIAHMHSLRKAFGENSKEFKHYVAQQQNTVKAMNTAGLFKERGSLYGLTPEEETETPQGAFNELKKIASEIMTAAPADKPITEAQAMELAGQRRPELKKKYREQFRSANTVKP